VAPIEDRRIPQLDGLRGLAIAMVIVWHYFVLPLREHANQSVHSVIAAGRLTWSGVDLFFVLSGFLIGGILLDQSESPNRFRTFYLRRAYRILPIYLLVCIAVESCFAAAHFHERSMPWYSYFTFTQNLWIARHNTFDPLLSYTWSLAVEEQFYLTLPWMIFYLSRRVLTNTLLFVTLSAPLLRYALVIFGFQQVAVHVLSPARADTLALGVLAAMAVRSEFAINLLAREKNKLRMAFLLPLVVMTIATIKDWRMGSLRMAQYGYSALALCYFLLLLELIAFPDSRLALWFRNGTLRWLGSISYGAYLLHQVVNMVCDRLIVSSHAGLSWRLTSAFIAIGATLGLAHLSWKLFESKLVNYARRFTYDEQSLPPFSIAIPSPS